MRTGPDRGRVDSKRKDAGKEYRKGQIVRAGGDTFSGARCRVERQSKHTGILTLTLLEDRRPYSTGDELLLYPYELKQTK